MALFGEISKYRTVETQKRGVSSVPNVKKKLGLFPCPTVWGSSEKTLGSYVTYMATRTVDVTLLVMHAVNIAGGWSGVANDTDAWFSIAICPNHSQGRFYWAVSRFKVDFIESGCGQNCVTGLFSFLNIVARSPSVVLRFASDLVPILSKRMIECTGIGWEKVLLNSGRLFRANPNAPFAPDVPCCCGQFCTRSNFAKFSTARPSWGGA